MIRIKRIYDPVDESDGRRILVDRLGPRWADEGTVTLLYSRKIKRIRIIYTAKPKNRQGEFP